MPLRSHGATRHVHSNHLPGEKAEKEANYLSCLRRDSSVDTHPIRITILMFISRNRSVSLAAQRL